VQQHFRSGGHLTSSTESITADTILINENNKIGGAMSTVHLIGDRLQIHLSVGEKIAALHGDLDIPRSAIRAAEVLTDGLTGATGVRAPGLAVPGRVKIGTWRSRRARSFVAARRDRPALRLTLDGQRYDTVVVSTPEAASLATALRTA
jgi:hypothetical protein